MVSGFQFLTRKIHKLHHGDSHSDEIKYREKKSGDYPGGSNSVAVEEQESFSLSPSLPPHPHDRTLFSSNINKIYLIQWFYQIFIPYKNSHIYMYYSIFIYEILVKMC